METQDKPDLPKPVVGGPDSNVTTLTYAEARSRLLRPTADSELMVALAESKIWAIRLELLAGIARADRSLAFHAGLFDDDDDEPSGPDIRNGVAIVGLHGVITPHGMGGLMALLFGGGGGLDKFLADVRSAVANPEARAVVLDMDSPGGLVDLVPEAAAQIRHIRDEGTKPIVAIANVQASSAAYWLASQANEVVVTPSGELGSIGVYSLHRDMSEAFAQRGIKHTLISAGKYKVEGNPYEPLTDEAAAAEQANVNDYYGMFVNDVASGRGVEPGDVADGYGEGRSLTAKRAVKAGLADKVATLPETISRLSSGRARVKRAGTSADDDQTPVASSYTKDERLRLIDALVSTG